MNERFVNHLVVRTLGLLPRRRAQLLVAWFFERRHRRAAPCMARHVKFFPSGVVAPDGTPIWAAAVQHGEDVFVARTFGADSIVLFALRSLVRRGGAPELLIDRSRIVTIGATRPHHPAFHVSFTLWERLAEGDPARAAALAGRDAEVSIARDAWLPDRRHAARFERRSRAQGTDVRARFSHGTYQLVAVVPRERLVRTVAGALDWFDFTATVYVTPRVPTDAGEGSGTSRQAGARFGVWRSIPQGAAPRGARAGAQPRSEWGER